MLKSNLANFLKNCPSYKELTRYMKCKFNYDLQLLFDTFSDSVNKPV